MNLPPNFYIWEGVYPDFASATQHAIGPGFSGEIYRSRSLLAAKECVKEIKDGNSIPQFHKQRSTYLPSVVSMMECIKDRPIKILDFGGGLGIGYLTLLESNPQALRNFEYSIVEDREVCEVGRTLFDKAGSITYLSEFPSGQRFDLVHAASSLQYVEKWNEMIGLFASLNPMYLLLSDIFAGNIESFVSLQQYYGSRIPHHFLNIDEFLSECSSYDLDLIMTCTASSRRLDVEDILPMDNFSEKHRIKQTRHILLKNKYNENFRKTKR